MRIKINISGLVQGVGFRPFVYRLAASLGLNGYILNSNTGVLIEAEGKKQNLDEFLIRLEKDRPAISRIYSLQHFYLRETGMHDFRIIESQEKGDKRVSVLPDIAVCEDCIQDITDPKNRRFIYPFTNCTNCGPRFTIIRSLPYDRKNTSMKDFTMCAACEAEYLLPSNRRFHAQPDACDACGPWVSLHDSDGQILCEKGDAVEKATNLIRKGYIIAIKGLGGYHLCCDATNEEAVQRLRKKKHREEKPLAVMFPDMDVINAETCVDMLEERAITSVEKPIVIVYKKEGTRLAESVSPGNSTVGVFLPYTPLHYLILTKLKIPVVATSANISDEPIVTEESDLFVRLARIADYYLTHNRDIARRCDDAVVRIISERQMPVRRSRGYVPLPIIVPFHFRKPVLALGPYMNCTIAVGIENRVYLSQHIGDLDTPLAMEFYEETVEDLLRLTDIDPEFVVSDMHPGYYSTKYGEKRFGDRLLKVQHHFAHILSCMTENEIPDDAKVIGFAFDGAGYGTDKTIWGSEVCIASYTGCSRVFHLKPFSLPGGEKSVTEPCRTALSLLYEIYDDQAADLAFGPLNRKEKSFFIEMIKKNINSPLTSSMGRLFDGAASLTGQKHKISYHAQAAIALEQLALQSGSTDAYLFVIRNNTLEHAPVIKDMVDDLQNSMPPQVIARKFHNAIVDMIVAAAEMIRKDTGIRNVALTGGVFQNAIISGQAFSRLKDKGFSPIMHQLVPPNDGGISLGQAVYAHFHQL